MSGLASGAVVRNALAAGGIQVIGWRWAWAPGAKGQTFEPHFRRDGVQVFNPEGFIGDNASQWGALPWDGLSVNSKYCLCSARMLLRGADGRFLPSLGVDRRGDV